MNIAIIPARGGSKRIPRKNIRGFCGKPMVAWSVAAAWESGLFEHVMVSTDDAEIAEVARTVGAEVPFMRPPELSNDHAGTTEVVAHAVQWAQAQGWTVQAACCIYATAPFVQAHDMQRGLAKLDAGDWAYAFSVTDFAAPIFRAFEASETGGIRMFFPDNFDKRSQDLPTAWHDAAQFYWGRPQAWISGLRIFAEHSSPVFVPRWRVQDIDTIDDWARAELMFEALQRRQEKAP